MSDVALKVLEYIQENPGTSYAEIERVFEEAGFDYEGEFEIYVDENVIFWTGWNEKAIKIMIELQQTGLVSKEPADLAVYLIAGKCLQLPLVVDIQQFSTPHWLPVAFVAIPQALA